MTARTRVQVLLLAAFTSVAGLMATRQPVAAAAAQATAAAQPMPVDPAIATAKLTNGLRYYVRANPKPEKRAELRLVVKAGSILEDDDQQGLAHFVEHMAFNGTQHFPKQDIIAFIESLGMRFGADLNAYTSFDETVYMLQVPTDKPEHARPRAAHPRRLGAQRHVRSGRDRQGARRHHGRVAPAAAARARA